MKKWTTQSGDEIPYNKIEKDHLINILRMIERLAKNGMEVAVNLGYGDHSYIEYDSYVLKGEEVFLHYDYAGLKKELTKRLIKPLLI